VEDFATLLLNQNEVEISDCLFNLCEQGASIEWLYLELMTRAARHIGFLWEEDRCSMVDVTLALGSLQQIVHQYSPVFQRQSLPTDRRRRALLLPAFGEQHTFGLSLVMEFFRREGWDLWSWPMLQEQELLSLLRNEWFAVVGITVGAEVNLAGLSALIRDLRRVSANRSLGIMVGGPIVLKYPHLARDLGADATGVDAHQAVLQAESLLNLQ
jgi:methanogenic corrinoid protein MtbC1